MFEIDRIPKIVSKALDEAGVSPCGTALSVFCDLTREQSPGEVYLLADANELCIVTGAPDCGDEKSTLSKGASLWRVLSVERIPLCELREIGRAHV